MKPKIKTEYRNRLPHIAPIGATFFVTFRLGDSLPQAIVTELKQSMDEKIKQLQADKKKGYEEEIRKQRKLFFKKYDHQLDAKPYGECHLRKPEVAKIVADKLHELDGDRYDLVAYCIMPNHVHVLFDTSIQLIDAEGFDLAQVPEDYVQLHRIMQSIKGSTAYTINKYLGKEGGFWQKDSYDHYVRDEREYWNIIHYILENPVKARLVKKWTDYRFHYLATKTTTTPPSQN